MKEQFEYDQNTPEAKTHGSPPPSARFFDAKISPQI